MPFIYTTNMRRRLAQGETVFEGIKAIIRDMEDRYVRKNFSILYIYVWDQQMAGLEARVGDQTVKLEFLPSLELTDQTIDIRFTVFTEKP